MAKYLPEFCLSLVGILNETNISEESFNEILEMIIKDEAIKALDKKKQDSFDTVMTSICNDISQGKETSPEKKHAAEVAASKLDKFRTWYRNRAKSTK